MTKTQKEKPSKKVKAEVIENAEVVKSEVMPVMPIQEQPLVPSDYKSKLTKPQIEIIKHTIAKGASDDELKMFLYVCERTKLDPFTKQIHLVPRWDTKVGAEVRVPIVGIDGLRSVAERTGAYAGNDDPVFDDEITPKKATVSVYKIVQGVRVPFTATARWEQYVPLKKDKTVASPLWIKMPHLMLGKCAEALALRKAFPAVMSGLYVQEEMAQATGTPGVPAVAERRPYDKAKEMIGKQTDPEVLENYLEKIKGSDKYTEKEKVDLSAMIHEQIGKIKIKLDKDAA